MRTRAALLAGLVLPLSIAALLGQACGGMPEENFGRRTAEANDAAAAAADPTLAFTAASTRGYMRQLAPYFVSRELDESELAAIEAGKFSAIAPMLTAWTKDPSFPHAARRVISQKLSVSGSRDGIDFDLPGNLAEYVVRENLPLTTLLTADYCIDAKGAKRECDTCLLYTF